MFIRNFYEDVLIKILRWIRSDHQQVRLNKLMPLSQSVCPCQNQKYMYILNVWIEFTYSFVLRNGQLNIASQYNLQMIAN